MNWLPLYSLVLNHFESKTQSSAGLGVIFSVTKLYSLLQRRSVYIFIRHLKLCAILNIFIKGLVLFEKSDGVLNKCLLKWFLRAFRKLWIILECRWHICSSMQSVQCLQIANLLNVIKLIGSINVVFVIKNEITRFNLTHSFFNAIIVHISLNLVHANHGFLQSAQ